MHSTSHRHVPASPFGAACALALLLAGCASTHEQTPSTARETKWLEPAPLLRQQIDQQAKRLPWVHGVEERVSIIQWFASVGEPAYPTLLDLVLDPRPDVAGAALAALGATHDERLVEPLRNLPWPTAENEDLALERARTLLFLGDWSMGEHLILGLRDERLFTRTLCIKALADVTGTRFDYEADGEPVAREAAVQRWEHWWQSRQVDPLLAKGKDRK
jgi:hypothetical protein